MRLLPSEDVAEVGQAPIKLTNGREAHVTMHVLEGSKEEIEKTVAYQPGSVLRSVSGDLDGLRVPALRCRCRNPR